jgi:hypothetical protein
MATTPGTSLSRVVLSSSADGGLMVGCCGPLGVELATALFAALTAARAPVVITQSWSRTPSSDRHQEAARSATGSPRRRGCAR